MTIRAPSGKWTVVRQLSPEIARINVAAKLD